MIHRQGCAQRAALAAPELPGALAIAQLQCQAQPVGQGPFTRAGLGNAFPVRADLIDPPDGVKVGMTAEVHFALARRESELLEVDGFLIPMAAAIAEPENGFSVFVFDPDSSTVSRRAIRSGGVQDNQIAVLEGLQAGDIIATAGVSFLRDGQEVKLLREDLGRSAR